MRKRFVIVVAAWIGLTETSARADSPHPRADEHPPISPEAMLDAAKDAEFFASLAIGDRERAAGHIPEAAIAYAQALKIRRDPVVGGRLGVLLVEVGKYAQAADLLSIALVHARTTTAERETYFRAYEVARQHGAWVDVVISQAGAAVALDGEGRNPGGFSAFSMFVVTGDHRLTTTLDGYQDATTPFTVRAGEDMRLNVELTPLFRRQAQIKPSAPTCVAAASIVGSNVATDPNYNPKYDPFYASPQAAKAKDAHASRPTHGSIFGGPIIVFGVASWMPALGGVVGGAWRPNQYFSLGLEGRAAWLTVGIAGEPIYAMAAGGAMSACGHVKWFFGCALGYAGATRTTGVEGTFTGPDWAAKLGGGGRVGARMRLSRTFGLAGTFDVIALHRRDVVTLEGKVLADQPPIMLSTQLLAGWEF
jgi:PEGA domain